MILYLPYKKIEKSHKRFRFRGMPKKLILGPFWAQILKSPNVGQTGFYQNSVLRHFIALIML